MSDKRGRPRKYSQFIVILDNDKVYSPSSIVEYGEEMGFFRGKSKENKRLAKLRIRHTLAAMKRNHKFPVRGDGLVIIKGNAPTPGWYGARWKAAIEE